MLDYTSKKYKTILNRLCRDSSERMSFTGGGSGSANGRNSRKESPYIRSSMGSDYL